MTLARRDWSDDRERADCRASCARASDRTAGLTELREPAAAASLFAAIGNRAAAQVVARMEAEEWPDTPPGGSGRAPEKPTGSSAEKVGSPSDQPRPGTLHRDGKTWTVEPDDSPRRSIKVKRLSGVRLTKLRLDDGTRCTFELDSSSSEAWHIATEVKKEKRGQAAAPEETPLQKLERETAQLIAQLLQLDEAACKAGALKVTEVKIPRSVEEDLRKMLKEFNQAQRFGAQKESALLDLYPLYIRMLQYLLGFEKFPFFRQLARCGFIRKLAAAASGSCHNMQTEPLLNDLDYMQKS